MKTARLNRFFYAAAFAVLPGLMLAPVTAYGLGIGAMGAALGTSPRDGVASAPAISLSGGAASKPAAQKPAARRTVARVPASQSPDLSKQVTSAKEVMTLADDTGPQIAFTAGWDSRYVFKDLDNLGPHGAAAFDEDASVWYAKASLAWNGFGFHVGYLQSAGEIVPSGHVAEIVDDSGPTGELVQDGGAELYQEIVTGVNYTLGVLADVEATLGYNAYFFPEKAFWGASFQGELFATLAYTGIEHLRPSVTYSYFHSDTGSLGGGFVDLRVDGSFDLCECGSVKVGFNPYVSLGYDIGFNDNTFNTDGFTAVDFGVKIPLALNENLVLTLSGNYGIEIDDEHTDVGDVGFWGGASLTYRF